ncbi:MAG TPA: Uma2 family endonuclease [Pseudonocardiaceae bacterium]|jgi:hypothetical protein|nr:Uma2 family endonuclease [Pseudonocardiaceae bacterium]
MTWPHHLLTLDEWDALPEETEFQLEIVDGVLIVSPRPMFSHQLAVAQLNSRLNGQLPAQFAAVIEGELVIAERPLTVRAPDVIVTSTAFAEGNPARGRPADVLLAVEADTSRSASAPASRRSISTVCQSP